MRAILVDDSRTIRMIVKKFLLAEGFVEIFEAGDGREALAKLQEVGLVDLAVVDWNMPVMDGLEFVKELRGNKAFDSTRIVMLTTEAEVFNAPVALDSGANAFMNKPFKADVLRSKLASLGFKRPVA